MSTYLKKKISLKVGDLLINQTGAKHDQQLTKQILYYLKLNRVDKNSKELGTFTLSIKSLGNNFKLNESLEKEINKSDGDDHIGSLKIDKNLKLTVKTNIDRLKELTLRDIYEKKTNYGFDLNADDIYPKKMDSQLKWFPKLTNNKTIVEYSSPNIAKPLHAGHMRSTFLGNFLSNLHEKLGNKLVRINYLGDWGTQYGKLAVGFKKYGSMEKLNESPIKHLLEVYVKANNDESIESEALAYFSDMESKNEETLKMWKYFKDLSIKELEQVYKKLNIRYDAYESESQYFEKARDWVKILCDRKLANILKDNAIEVKIEDPILNKSKGPIKYIVQKSDGTTLYITRDIAALFERKKTYNFSKIVYVVDSSQKEHFVKLYETANKLDRNVLQNITFQEFYVPFGRLTNMSTRKGKVEFLSDLIAEAKQVAFESMDYSKTKKVLDDPEYVAENIGNSHLIISDLQRPRLKDYEFSWSNIVSKDDSAYMCHYAHARLHSLIKKCNDELKLKPDFENVNLKLLNKPIELILIQHLARFDEVVWQAYEEYEPYHIVQYLFQLVRLTNLCLKENYVFQEPEEVAKARLLLYSSCKQVICNSFHVIGVTPLNQI